VAGSAAGHTSDVFAHGSGGAVGVIGLVGHGSQAMFQQPGGCASTPERLLVVSTGTFRPADSSRAECTLASSGEVRVDCGGKIIMHGDG
jgi:hypothetical protein